MVEKNHELMIEYMHEFLDDDILPEREAELREHLKHCADCRLHFNELRKAVALVQSTSHIQAPAGFTQSVMMKLPKEKKKNGLKRLLGRHPILVAAAVFMILMTTSLVSAWNEDDQFAVTMDENIIVQDNTAIVPEGKVVKGDIVVRNGDIRIEGTVEGNVTIINGEKYMAKAGQVTGEIEEINMVFDWIWHHIKSFFKDVFSGF